MGIQMNQKELTKTFMMISNWKNPFSLQDFFKKNSALQGLKATPSLKWLNHSSAFESPAGHRNTRSVGEGRRRVRWKGRVGRVERRREGQREGEGVWINLYHLTDQGYGNMLFVAGETGRRQSILEEQLQEVDVVGGGGG